MPGRAGISETRPSSPSAAISGVTESAAMSTEGARFNSSRVLTSASSPPPVTSGGLPSKLPRMGKVRMGLASHRPALDRRISEALRRKFDFEPVQFLRHDDLAAEPRVLVDIEGTVEHLELLAGGRHELRHPIRAHPHMA